MCIVFLQLQWLLSYQQFCDFSLNKSCKAYLESKLPPGGRNWQLISPHCIVISSCIYGLDGWIQCDENLKKHTNLKFFFSLLFPPVVPTYIIFILKTTLLLVSIFNHGIKALIVSNRGLNDFPLAICLIFSFLCLNPIQGYLNIR